MPRLRRMQREALADGWLPPRAVYGYFPCHADGDDLVIFDACRTADAEIERFNFPRQADEDHLCITDYFAPAASGRRMWWPSRWSRWGQGPRSSPSELQADGDYSESFSRMASAWRRPRLWPSTCTGRSAANWACAQRRANAIAGAIPPVRIWPTTPRCSGCCPRRRPIGVSLTDAYQLVPEQSTAAIIIHHPQATYFMVREGKRDVQLAAAAQSRA